MLIVETLKMMVHFIHIKVFRVNFFNWVHNPWCNWFLFFFFLLDLNFGGINLLFFKLILIPLFCLLNFFFFFLITIINITVTNQYGLSLYSLTLLRELPELFILFPTYIKTYLFLIFNLFFSLFFSLISFRNFFQHLKFL